MASTVNERLNLKQCQVDVWTTREQLCLASAVMRSGDQNWAAVSRTLRLLSTEKDRPPDWYSTKNCAIQYGKLLEQVDTPKRKRERNESNETPEESVTRMLTKQRIEELQGVLEEEKSSYNQLYKEVTLLKTGQLDHCLNRLWDEIIEEQQKEEEEKTKHENWLKEREQKIQAIQSALKSSSKGWPFKKSSPTKFELPSGRSSMHIEPPSDTFKGKMLSSPSENSSDLDSLEEKPEKTWGSGPSSPSSSTSILKSELLPTSTSSDSLTKRASPNFRTKAMEDVKEEPNKSDLEITSHIKSERDSSLSSDIKSEDRSTPHTFKRSSFGREEDSKEFSPMKSIVHIQSPKSERYEEKRNFKFFSEGDTVKSVGHSPHKEISKSESDFDKLLESHRIQMESQKQIHLDTKDGIKKGDDKSAKPIVLSPGQTKISKEESPIKPEPKKEVLSNSPDVLTRFILDSRDSKTKIEACSQDSNIVENVAESKCIKPIVPFAEKVGDSSPELDSSSEMLERKESDKSFTGFSSTDEMGLESCFKKKLRKKKESEIKEEKCEEKVLPKEEIIEEEAYIVKKETKKEIKLEENVVDLKDNNDAIVKQNEKEIKQEKLDDENLSKVPSTLPSRDNIYDEETSRDSMEVKDILGRSDKRKLSPSEGVASPVISESTPSSPASTNYGDDPEGEKAHRTWKRSIMIIWNDIAAHKNASIFLRPITEDKVPGYRSVVLRPADLQTIKRQIEMGAIRTTAEFQRDILLMFLNAQMYNQSDHNIYKMAQEMMSDVTVIIEEFVSTHLLSKVMETPQKSLRRETRESSAKRIEGDLKRKRETEDKTFKRRKLN